MIESPNTGILMDIPLVGESLLVTDPFTVPIGEPLQLELYIALTGVTSLTAQALGINPSGSTASTADYASTRSFPETGPVFDLPEGYSVDSVQGGIESNQVPEPSAGTLAVAALATLARLRHARC